MEKLSLGSRLLVLSAFCACSGDGAPFSGSDVGATGTSDGGVAVSDAWVGNQPTCSGTVYACSDGKDNDGDGKVDAADGECVGPCDNDEASFATGISGDNKDACKQDCFFDGNSGQGDDGCEWNLKCDPLSPGATLDKSCPYDAAFQNCPATQTQACVDNCRGLTPNGCDCFGCCQVSTGDRTFTVFLGSGTECSASAPDKCTSCTPNPSCINDCGECELCLGRTIDDLPAKCFAAGPDAGVGPDAGGPRLPTCDDSRTACLDNDACPLAYYCITGCCTLGIQ